MSIEEIRKYNLLQKDSQLKSNLRALIQQEKGLIKSQMPIASSAKQKKPGFDFFFMQNNTKAQHVSQSAEKVAPK